MVLNDLLGGDLVRGEVHRDGVRTDHHWWNRLAEGVEVDLTREQFSAEETVTPGTVIRRPAKVGERPHGQHGYRRRPRARAIDQDNSSQHKPGCSPRHRRRV